MEWEEEEEEKEEEASKNQQVINDYNDDILLCVQKHVISDSTPYYLNLTLPSLRQKNNILSYETETFLLPLPCTIWYTL